MHSCRIVRLVDEIIKMGVAGGIKIFLRKYVTRNYETEITRKMCGVPNMWRSGFYLLWNLLCRLRVVKCTITKVSAHKPGRAGRKNVIINGTSEQANYKKRKLLFLVRFGERKNIQKNIMMDHADLFSSLVSLEARSKWEAILHLLMFRLQTLISV